MNSFGFGGVNAHVILQSHHTGKTKNQGHIQVPPIPPLMISARSAGALQQLAADYAGFLESRTTGDYYNIAYSAAFTVTGTDTGQPSSAPPWKKSKPG